MARVIFESIPKKNDDKITFEELLEWNRNCLKKVNLSPNASP